jgi:hypothetical protein
MIKALSFINRMVEIKPDIYNENQLQMLKNLVHYPQQSVKEEVGELLISLSEEFEDSS